MNFDSKTGLPILPNTERVKIAEGSMGVIYRTGDKDINFHWVEKEAKTPKDNVYLQREFQVLRILKKNGGNVPKVIAEHPVSAEGEKYCFEMEDLSKYKPLFDSQGNINVPADFSKIMFIAQDVYGTLMVANKLGYLHNDVQLANVIMVDEKLGAIVSDWGNVLERKEGNQMTDVRQFADFLGKLFLHQDFMPGGIKTWTRNVDSFKAPEEAWDKFGKSWGDDIAGNEFNKLDKDVKEYGPVVLGKK